MSQLPVAVVDPVDVAAIAARLETTPGMVHQWRRRSIGFPDPVVVLNIGPVWAWAHVAAWASARRAPGRPSRSGYVAASIGPGRGQHI